MHGLFDYILLELRVSGGKGLVVTGEMRDGTYYTLSNTSGSGNLQLNKHSINTRLILELH
jgi:hypothetical protein